MLELDRPNIEAMGIRVYEYELATGTRYIRHDHEALARAILDVYQKNR